MAMIQRMCRSERRRIARLGHKERKPATALRYFIVAALGRGDSSPSVERMFEVARSTVVDVAKRFRVRSSSSSPTNNRSPSSTGRSPSPRRCPEAGHRSARGSAAAGTTKHDGPADPGGRLREARVLSALGVEGARVEHTFLAPGGEVDPIGTMILCAARERERPGALFEPLEEPDLGRPEALHPRRDDRDGWWASRCSPRSRVSASRDRERSPNRGISDVILMDSRWRSVEGRAVRLH